MAGKPDAQGTLCFPLICTRAPLCRFLKRPVPAQKFPHGNFATEFGPKLMVTDAHRLRRAKQNLILIICLVVVPVIACMDLVLELATRT